MEADKVAIKFEDLSEAEQNALQWLKSSVVTFVYNIEPKTTRDMHGSPIPGMTIFRKLEQKGLCYQTVEDKIFLNEGDEEPFEFSSTMELTDEGLALFKEFKRS
jgi:hypothetical protein